MIKLCGKVKEIIKDKRGAVLVVNLTVDDDRNEWNILHFNNCLHKPKVGDCVSLSFVYDMDGNGEWEGSIDHEKPLDWQKVGF